MNAVKIYEKASWDVEHSKITLSEFEERIKPLYDVEPVRHGRNIGTDYAACDQFVCSECGIHLQDWVRIDEEDYADNIVHEYEFKYCPNCGAKIEEQEHE